MKKLIETDIDANKYLYVRTVFGYKFVSKEQFTNFRSNSLGAPIKDEKGRKIGFVKDIFWKGEENCPEYLIQIEKNGNEELINLITCDCGKNLISMENMTIIKNPVERREKW